MIYEMLKYGKIQEWAIIRLPNIIQSGSEFSMKMGVGPLYSNMGLNNERTGYKNH